MNKWACDNSRVAANLVDTPQRALGDRRAEVLAALQKAERPASAADVAASVGLHVNTARFHLDGLVHDGLARRAPEPREAPGRPRVLYAPEPPSSGARSYALLAEVLTGLVSSLDDAGPATRETGRAWGRHLVERAPPHAPVGASEALDRLNRLLDEIGFQPVVRHAEHTVEVRLHHCPFREVARQHPDVVCAIHLGLMQGALDELGAPVSVASLEPFPTPELCIARLQAQQDGE